MNAFRSATRSLFAGALLALFFAPGLLAQQETQEEQKTNPDVVSQDDTITDVIVVTARRREEPLQTVPVAVTAITPEDLEERNVTQIAEITDITPNLKLDAVTYSSTTARVYIRGVGQDDSVITADPGVGIYVDGVYLGRSQAALQAINDLERVEVLRGPQGTLYGRNTIGGAINLITADPTAGFGGNLMLRTGNDSLIETRLSANLTDSERFGVRASIASVDRDGYMKNAFDGGDRNDQGLLGGRLKFRYGSGNSFSSSLALDYTDQDRRASIGECRYTGRGALVGVANIFGFSAACQDTANDGDPFRGASDFDDTDTSTASGATLSLNWSGSKMDFLSTSSYREGDSKLSLDIDLTAVNYFTQLSTVDFDQFSQELQINGASDKSQYTAGAYYFEEKVKGSALTTTLRQFPLTPFVPAINALNTDVLSQPKNESLALYGQASFDVGEKLSLTGGLRYTEDTKEIDYFSLLFLTNSVAADFTQSKDFNEVTGLASAGYEFTDRAFGYLSASRGFKSGGFNGRPLPGQGGLEPFDAEFVDTYELGLKGTLASGKLVLNGALFYSDYQDMQLTIFQTTPTGGFASVVRNAGAATVQGAEIEFQTRTGTGLDVFGHFGLIDAGYDEFLADLNGDGTISDNSYLDFKHTPPYDFSFGVRYSTAIAQSNLLMMQAEITGRDKTQSVTANVPGTQMTSYELINARVSYDFLDSKLQLAVWGRNLGDETYTTTGLSFGESLGYNLVFYAMPRSYGADLRWRF